MDVGRRESVIRAAVILWWLPKLALCEQLCVPWRGSVGSIVEESLSFLPSSDDLASATEAGQDVEDLRNRLRDLGRRCVEPYYPVASMNAWGSHINSMVFPLAYAVSHHRTMLSPALGAYANGSCDTLACFFRPLASSNCEGQRQRRRLHKSDRCSDRKRLFWCGDSARDGDCEARPPQCRVPEMRAVALKKGEFSYALHGNAAIPAEFSHRGHFWYVAQLLSWLLRPNKGTIDAIKRRAVQLGMAQAQRPMVGIHARAGDSCRPSQMNRKARRCSPFDEYWYHALAMTAKYNARSVFFATDDAALATRAANVSSPQLPVYVSHTQRNSEGVVWDTVLRNGHSGGVQLDRTQTALDIIVDIALLAKTDAFIGKFTSNVDRIAYALLAARSNCLKPYVSLDALWCHDWSNPVGRSVFGSFLC